MKKTGWVAFAAAVVFAVSLFLPSQGFATNEEDWAFVQSVGGMKLGELQRHSDEWRLAVDIDVTGSREITVAPTAPKSDIICENIQADIHGSDIFLALYVGHPWIGTKTGGCPAVALGQPAAGNYTVYYNGLGGAPVKLGEISIPAF